jgi:hypothetical protein
MREIVLPYEDAFRALEYITAGGHRVLGWEGWLVYRDGRTGHSALYQGTTDLSGLSPERAVEVCKATMGGAHIMESASPEHPEATLQFCISVAAA